MESTYPNEAILTEPPGDIYINRRSGISISPSSGILLETEYRIQFVVKNDGKEQPTRAQPDFVNG